MQRTRGKKDLNMGVQPLIQGVKHTQDVICLLSENPKMRGDMTNLKKMLLPNVREKIKIATSVALSNGCYLCYAGVDSINMHFSNIPIRSPFIEFVLLKKSGSDVNFSLVVSLAIRDVIMKELNDTLIRMAGDDTCTTTASILSSCRAGGGLNGNYFSERMISEFRFIIDFNYDVTTSEPKKQPFIEIRALQDLKVIPFEKDGVYYLPFGSVASDINVGIANESNSDWIFRLESLKECLSRTGTSLTYFAFHSMARICFPGVTMMKMKVREAVASLIDEAILNAPQNRGGILSNLKTELYGEISLYEDQKALSKCVTFENFLKRCRLLGLLPDADSRNGDIIANAYNETTFDEFKKVNLA